MTAGHQFGEYSPLVVQNVMSDANSMSVDAAKKASSKTSPLPPPAGPLRVLHEFKDTSRPPPPDAQQTLFNAIEYEIQSVKELLQLYLTDEVKYCISIDEAREDLIALTIRKRAAASALTKKASLNSTATKKNYIIKCLLLCMLIFLLPQLELISN